MTRSAAPMTIRFLWEHRNDETRPTAADIGAHFGIERQAVHARIREARRFLAEHGDPGFVIPRPTAQTGFTYTVTNQWHARDGSPTVLNGRIDDDKMMIAMLDRNIEEFEVVLPTMEFRSSVYQRAVEAKAVVETLREQLREELAYLLAA